MVEDRVHDVDPQGLPCHQRKLPRAKGLAPSLFNRLVFLLVLGLRD